MRASLRSIWEKLHASYWFLPMLLMLLAACLAFVTLALDARIRGKILQEQGWVYSGGPEGARAVLATIAGSIITVAGTTFSITIAVLSMASGQFGPRLLRNFMRDRGSQAVLGAFVATFLYCLLVLRTVRGTNDNTYVPHLSVTIGTVLSVICLGALIYFIHHTAESIQVTTIIDVVGRDLDSTLCRKFPEAPSSTRSVTAPELPLRIVMATTFGYVQNIDQQELLERAGCEHSLFRLVRPGDYVMPGIPLLEILGNGNGEDDSQIQREFTLGSQRTPNEDPEFGFLQLVEIAVRALSPGINDPFTAIMCIDRLSASLCLLAERFDPPAELVDEKGEVRVMQKPYQAAELAHSAFSQIRHNGKSTPAIVDHLRKQIDVVLTRAREGPFRNALERERDLLREESRSPDLVA